MKNIYLLVYFIAASALLFATNPPKDGKFPEGFWQTIEADTTILKYGNDAWVKRLDERRETMQLMSEGKMPYKKLAVDNFKLPVLLGSFNDKAGVKTAAEFQNHLFGSNPTGNITEFYNEVSYGQFNLTGTVTGWYKADQNMSFYTATNNGMGGTYPATGKGFVVNIAQKADPTVNFAQFDNDGPDGVPNSGDDDGYVDAVLVVHAGAGPDWGTNNNSIWPHMSSLGNNEVTTNDPSARGGFIKINTYAVVPEIAGSGSGNGQIRPIGVYVHEFGHILGLPDLYDRTNVSEGVGGWCLMGSGSWGGDNAHPDRPAHPSAWAKWQKGWLSPQLIIGNINGLSLPPVETNATAYILWEDGYGLSRYFLIENRQKTGFDTHLPGSGLMIYHIDENRRWGRYSWSSGLVNDDRLHKLVDIEEADGRADLDNAVNRGDAGDIYPGSANNTSFTAFSSPNSFDYDGNQTGVEIKNITQAGSTVTADVVVRQQVGYGLAYDEYGVTGWGFGYQNPQDIWGGVLFTASVDGYVNSIDLGFRESNTEYEVYVYTAFSNLTPSGLGATASGTAQQNGWHTVKLNNEVQVNAGQKFFAAVKIKGKAYGLSYDVRGNRSGNSFYSTNGVTYNNDISVSSGDLNIRARIRSATAVAVEDEFTVPSEYNLAQNYPNPFNPTTVIKYSVAQEGAVSLKVFDALGREVKTLINQNQPAGNYSAEFNADGFAAGMYIIRMQAGSYSSTVKTLLLK